MKSLNSWTIRALGMLLLATLASGCFTGQHRQYWHNHRAIDEGDRGRQGSWDSGQNAHREHDGNWQAEQNSGSYSQGYSRDAH